MGGKRSRDLAGNALLVFVVYPGRGTEEKAGDRPRGRVVVVCVCGGLGFEKKAGER